MAVVNKMELGRELFRTISQINVMIDKVKAEAASMGVESADLRDTKGNFVLVPLISAKAQCLHALAIINQRD
jgi:hypothetical protein